MTFSTDPASPFAMGARLKSEQDEIFALTKKLRSSVGEAEVAPLLAPIEDGLSKALASISFIGQVKAGKTSLVNSLIAKPGFLPSDVNPWTAVVTRLFFGNPGGPDKGAHFVFFDDQQWDKFANRGGRLGELAEEIPDSEEKLNEIRLEVEQMRERAQKQLGHKFQALLGKTHKFDTATTDVLARYICAGDDPETLIKQNVQGRYADITREASVYFKQEKFAFPCVMVDTPGLNDPLMIREEITLQSLEHSQVFVLVLSAHQAFSSADLYLVRILNALRMDRLVIFVNRADELTNPETDIPSIRKHIAKFMAKECPGVEIPIIFGSAACASNAISGATATDPAKVALMLACDAGKTKIESNTVFEQREQQQAWQASGLPALEKELSDLIYEGPGKAWLTSARIDLDNAAKLILANTEAEMEALKQQHDRMSNKKRGMGREAKKPKFTAQHFDAECAELFTALGHKLETNLNAAWSRIGTGLQEITERFIADHDKAFAAYLVRARKSKKPLAWSCDTAPLRRDLNLYLREEFPLIQSSILENIEIGVEEISSSMVDAGLLAAKNLRINTADLAGQSVSTSALSKVVAIDMDASWWKGWISKFMRSSKIRERVAKMIRAQFLPIQNELVDSMNKQLVASSQAAMTSYQNTLSSLVEIVTADSKQPMLTTVEDIEAKIKALGARAKICKAVSTTLQQALAA